ncbi:hypothetical protein JR316_0010193 [Psilocybe cubensis]|uniref:MYND-type domain-containing protein n=2 Tax=Psilocybe cubensis TaxID=181762 RepID=A0A8H8CH99_PSICU|nr:hypothetical protein JR316_0010193 [Psilocybe cubensis]KAH9477960.1 hypothetical protein JR316_0010193 [Psilocybe cubensis]
MPGPGSHGKSKGKSNQSPAGQSTNILGLESIQLGEKEDLADWTIIIGAICEFLHLPDLNSRNGFKKVYADFDVIHDRLQTLFDNSKDSVRVRGAIVGILGKMCTDSLLRNKVFAKDILSKVLPLLREDETRHLALHVLDTITHHGGIEVRLEVARHTNTIAKLIDDLPDDEVVSISGVAILAHATVTLLDGDDCPHPKILKTIDMTIVIKSVLEAVKRFYTRSHSFLEHAIHLIATSSLHASYAFKAYPAALSFLAVGLRSKDWVTRCICLGGFVRAFSMEAQEHEVPFDPRKFVATYQTSGIPQHLSRIMMAYGPTNCDTIVTLSCINDSQKAIRDYADSQERDLRALALKQAALITKAEHAIMDGYFQVQDERTGQFVAADMGLPFTTWRESLHHTANAIRRQGNPGEEDLADILELKYLIGKQALDKVMNLARKAIQRNPEQSYFYYALSLTADNVQGLRASKKGLKCKSMTPFVKYQLLQRAVDHAADMGIKLMQTNPPRGDRKWEEAIAFVMTALQDAKTYIKEAPPDSRHIKTVGYWYVLLSILVNPAIDPSLKELDDIVRKLHIADEFSELMGTPPPQSNLRLSQKAILKHYPLGFKQFAHIMNEFDRFYSLDVQHTTSKRRAEDNLTAWLEDMKLEDNTIDDLLTTQSFQSSQTKIHFDENKLTLYRCSWCGNPSAVLRKCGGCSNTRYCDSACQKAHWKGHKKECTSGSSNAS